MHKTLYYVNPNSSPHYQQTGISREFTLLGVKGCAGRFNIHRKNIHKCFELCGTKP